MGEPLLMPFIMWETGFFLGKIDGRRKRRESEVHSNFRQKSGSKRAKYHFYTHFHQGSERETLSESSFHSGKLVLEKKKPSSNIPSEKNSFYYYYFFLA